MDIPGHIAPKLEAMGRLASHLMKKKETISFTDVVVLLDERGRFWTGVSWRFSHERPLMSSDALKGAVGALLAGGGRSIDAIVFCGKSYIIEELRRLRSTPLLPSTCLIRMAEEPTSPYSDKAAQDL